METKILPIDSRSLQLAEKLLSEGKLVAFPTETVYGLGADARNDEAVKLIYATKGRPSDNPLIVHVDNDYVIAQLVTDIPDYAKLLAKAFLPGPLTMVYKSRGVVSPVVSCGLDTLAVRVPSHKGAQQFLKFVGMPVAAPSANLSKHVSPVTAQHVYSDLGGRIELILDGGKCSGGIESTVVDVTGDVPRILRAGLITKEMIEKITGKCEIARHKETDKVRSPGVKYRHYRPNCETALFKESELDKVKELYESYLKAGKKPYVLCSDSVKEKLGDMNFLLLGKNEEEIASNLYLKLLEGEKIADIIIAVEMPDEKGVNLGIMNRLRKSCG